MSQEEFIQVFEKLGALLTGHFVLTSNQHSDHYVNKDMVSSSPYEVQDFADQVLEKAGFAKPDLVVAPAVGAIVFGILIASELSSRFAYAESENGKMVFGRGFDALIKPGKSVVIAEDVVTTGTTLRQMVTAVQELGGEIKGVVLLWRRGEIDLGNIKVTSLIEKEFPVWEAEDCELCRGEVPLSTAFGHGPEFLKEFGPDPSNWPANRHPS